MDQEETIKSALKAYEDKRFELEQFLKRMVNFFSDHPKLNSGSLPIIHSIKYRLKDKNRLDEKIRRKWDTYGSIDSNNIFDLITDLAGVRILHLYQAQFQEIHNEIIRQVTEEEWFFGEPPKAYTWDPESYLFYNNLGINCAIKDSYYTSIHYLVQPKRVSHIKCEIQVRTLFEEIWGEIDHNINYPSKTESIACKEQLKVLARLSSTGTKLADSIFLSHKEHLENSAKIETLNEI